VGPGSSARHVARDLAALGFTHHPLFFRVLASAREAGAHLKAGEYTLEGSLSLSEVLDKLVRGDVVRRLVTFPEGKSIGEMAQLVERSAGLAAEDFLKAARDPRPMCDLDPDASSLEGYLFPDTYVVQRTPDAAAQLVARMVHRFRDVVRPELPRYRERGLTLRQAVTLASLVELETAQGNERPRIAAVFLNRLKKKMLLQTDPTVIYALREAGRYDGNIRKADLQIASPYNTYVHAGLPPGPIAAPGRAALRAVAEPAQVEELFFVSRNDGTHVFSTTLADHERAVDRYQRRRAPARAAPRVSANKTGSASTSLRR
jgi:UPF0755 protein